SCITLKPIRAKTSPTSPHMTILAQVGKLPKRSIKYSASSATTNTTVLWKIRQSPVVFLLFDLKYSSTLRFNSFANSALMLLTKEMFLATKNLIEDLLVMQK